MFTGILIKTQIYATFITSRRYLRTSRDKRRMNIDGVLMLWSAFTHYLEQWSSLPVVFITPYLMQHSVSLWNSPSMHSANTWNTAYSYNVFTWLLNKKRNNTGNGIRPYTPKWFGLVASIFYSVISLVVFVYICVCTQIIFIHINSFIFHSIQDFKYWYQCHQ